MFYVKIRIISTNWGGNVYFIRIEINNEQPAQLNCEIIY